MEVEVFYVALSFPGKWWWHNSLIGPQKLPSNPFQFIILSISVTIWATDSIIT
jgi:hypothetical protein